MKNAILLTLIFFVVNLWAEAPSKGCETHSPREEIRPKFAFKDGVRHTVFHRVATGHDCTTRGRTRRAYKKPREARAGVIKLIEIRRANPWMAVPTNGAVALIICDNQNNIRLLSLGG